MAEMPYYAELLEKYPHTLIQASGECVGLPAGIMGNSNVGHLCMGAGRVVRTDIEHINHEIKTGAFFHNLALNAAMDSAAKHDRALHIIDVRHPLLDERLAAAREETFKERAEDRRVVPITIELDREKCALVISGPNAGGKSITLKTVGVLQVMLQSGLLVPVAAGSRSPSC